MSNKTMFAVAALVVLAVVGSLATLRGNTPKDFAFEDVAQRPPIPSDEQEKRILDVLEAMCPARTAGY